MLSCTGSPCVRPPLPRPVHRSFRFPTDVVTALVSAIQAMAHDASEFSELRYEDALRAGLATSLANVIRLGTEADFAPGSTLRACVIDNADVVREAMLASGPPPVSAAWVEEDNWDGTGTAVVERLLMFVI